MTFVTKMEKGITEFSVSPCFALALSRTSPSSGVCAAPGTAEGLCTESVTKQILWNRFPSPLGPGPFSACGRCPCALAPLVCHTVPASLCVHRGAGRLSGYILWNGPGRLPAPEAWRTRLTLEPKRPGASTASSLEHSLSARVHLCGWSPTYRTYNSTWDRDLTCSNELEIVPYQPLSAVLQRLPAPSPRVTAVMSSRFALTVQPLLPGSYALPLTGLTLAFDYLTRSGKAAETQRHSKPFAQVSCEQCSDARLCS